MMAHTAPLEARDMKLGSKLAIALFALVAIGHLLRLIIGIPMTVGEWGVPQWISVFGVIAPGVIAYLLWKESR
jgi:membrane protein CcdC involved in cytochrome C biogenesis